MNSNVLSVREAERVKTSNNRFRSLDTNTREEIMDRERKRKERARKIYYLMKVYRLVAV
jgi:hypothetical protein